MEKYSKCLALLVFTLFYVSLVSCSTAQKNFATERNMLEKTVSEMKSCIVQIKVRASNIPHSNGKPLFLKEWVAGTGFLVNEEGYIITNAHVILDSQNELKKINAEKKEILVGLAFDYSDPMVTFRGSFIITPFKIIEIDEVNDIAIIKTNANPSKGEIKSGIVIKEKQLPVEISTCKLSLIRPAVGDNIAISG